jgi:tetratricopeptide (TPR) repeat protein
MKLTLIVSVLITLSTLNSAFAEEPANGDNQSDELFLAAKALADKDYNKALVLVEKVLAKSPDNINALHIKAMCKHWLCDYQGAIDAYSRILHIYPLEPTCLRERANLYKIMKKFDEAFADIDNSIKIRGDSPALYIKGLILSENAQYDNAIDVLSMCLFINWGWDNWDQVYYARGFCRNRAADYENAKNDFLKACEVKKTDLKYFYELSFALCRLGDYDNAIRYSTRAIQLDNSYCYEYYQRARAYEKIYDYSRAIIDFNSAIAFGLSNYSLVYADRGRCYLLSNNSDAAVKDFEQALRINDNTVNINFDIGLAYFKNGMYQKAENYFKVAAEKSKDNKDAAYSKIWQWICIIKTGNPTEISSEEFFKDVKCSDFPRPVIDYLNEKIDFGKLLFISMQEKFDKAKNQYGFALFVVGENLIASGESKKGLYFLMLYKNMKNHEQNSYDAVIFELSRIQ